MEKAASGRLILVLPETRRGGSSGKKPIRGDGTFGAGLPSMDEEVRLALARLFGSFLNLWNIFNY